MRLRVCCGLWATSLLLCLVSASAIAQGRLWLDGSALEGARLPRELEDAARLPLPSDDLRALRLVFFPGPTEGPWLEALRRAGLEVLQYAPRHAYVVLGTAAEVERAARSAPILDRGPLPPALKLHPLLRSVVKGVPPGAAPRSASKRLDVIIQAFDIGDLDAFRRYLGESGGRERSVARLGRRVHIRAVVPVELLAPMALWPSVYRLEPFPRLELQGEREAQISAGDLAPDATCAAPGYAAWLQRKNVTGAGIAVQLMDDGLEQGNSSGLPGTAHPDLLGAILGVENATSDPDADCKAGHGSLNAGIVAGRGVSGGLESGGFLRGLGLAPGAQVFGTKIFNNLGRFDVENKSFSELARTAAERGTLISSNSWGSSSFGQYDANCAEFDALTRNALGDAGDQPMTFFFSTGNEGDETPGGLQSIGSPASAKNVIAVGATESCDADGVDGCGSPPAEADSIRDVPLFSSRGPTSDGRLGPTLVAPGTHVAGVASTARGYDGSGVCDAFWPTGQVLFARSSGTSHACPQVAAAGALFVEAYLRQQGEVPRPSLIKAALVATARDLAGGADGLGGVLEAAPSAIQGWGRLSLEGLIPDAGLPRSYFAVNESVTLDDTGDEWESRTFPLVAGAPVRIVLAWTDPPALPGVEPTLVNDLDLEVVARGKLYRGNVFSGGVSVEGGEADRLQNLEAVYLDDPGAILTVRVRGANIAGDGAPAGDDTDQDFSIFIVNGTNQSSVGSVRFRRPAYACNSLVGLEVSDLDLKGQPRVQVEVSSPSAASPLTVELTEVTAGSGFFDGAFELGAGVGRLLVQHGDQLVAVYRDRDDGTGAARDAIDTAAVDCQAPALSDINVDVLSDTSVRASWSTSEDTKGVVLYGTDCKALKQELSSLRRSSTHSVVLSGLPLDSRLYYTITAEDAVGNKTTADNGGACLSFHTIRRICYFSEDVEGPVDPGWSHSSAQGPDDWAPATFRGSKSPTRSWHAPGLDGFKDSSLVTPPLNLREGDRLRFWHTYQLENGYDGAVLEVSVDGGASWLDAGTGIVSGGYTDVISGNPLGERFAWTGSRDETMTEVEVNVDAWAGSGRRFRFRIGSDSSLAEGFGWYIDDVSVCRSLSPKGRLSLNRVVCRCQDSILVTLEDADLVGSGTVMVEGRSTSHPEAVALELVEDAGGGVFSLALALDGDLGRLPVADGDEVSVSYLDADDGTSSGPRESVRSTRVDCASPSISNVRLLDIFDAEAVVQWETDEPTAGEAFAGADCAAGAVRSATAFGGLQHVVTLQGLEAGAPQRLRIVVRDEAGNVSVDDAGGACRVFVPPQIHDVREDLEDGAPGWSHVADVGKDAWELVEWPGAASPTRAWHLPGQERKSDMSLVTPCFRVLPASYASFWHTYEFEHGFDGAVIEASVDGGDTWTDLGHAILRGGYSDLLVEPNPLAGRMAWTGGEMGPMTRVVVDLASLAGEYVRLRFRATSDPSVSGRGWAIDQLEICRRVRERAELLLDRLAYPCSGEAKLQLLDSGRVGAGQVEAPVVSSTSPGGVVATLLETATGSGVFEGVVSLSQVQEEGALQVSPGDTLTARYLDQDDGSGASREVLAEADIDCTPPSHARVSVVQIGSEEVTVLVEADDLSTSRLELGLACNALNRVVVSSRPTTIHRFMLGGLEPGTAYRYRIVTEDLAGNRLVDDAGGVCRSLRTAVNLTLFEDDLEPTPAPGWHAGSGWIVVESDRAASAPHAWAIFNEGAGGEVSSLTSPLLRVSQRTRLEFWHVFSGEEGLSGGVLEGSIDGGATWVDLGASILEGGYGAFLTAANPLGGRRAWTGGEALAPSRVVVDLGALVPPEGAEGPSLVLVRFRWANSLPAGEGGWSLDDFKVSEEIGASGKAIFDRPAYVCSTTGTVLLADSELAGQPEVSVEVGADGRSGPFAILLSERTPGVFEGPFTLSDATGLGLVEARDGDTLRLTYRDSSDGDGQPRVVVDAVPVDCTPPELSAIRLGAAASSALEVLWLTNEPARSTVRYGATCEALTSSTSEPSYLLGHQAILSGLPEDAQGSFELSATDVAGNETRGACSGFEIRRSCDLEAQLEQVPPGWSHSATVGTDDWKIVKYEFTHSPPNAYFTGNNGQLKDARLQTSPVDIERTSVLTFWHTYDFEAGFDGALVEISQDGGQSWQELGAQILEGGYTGTLAGGVFDGVHVWTGGRVGSMTRVSVDLSSFAGPGRRIGFRALCDDSVGSGGWYIDAVSVCSFAGVGLGSFFIRGECNADGRTNISDAIFLLNHLFLGGRAPPCEPACDTDGNDRLNLTDAVYFLNYLFRGGAPPPPPNTCEPAVQQGTLACERNSC